jgi:hypothetical protein
VVRRVKREQSTQAGDWLVGRRTRSLGFFAVLLVFAVSRPSAAQIATASFADLGRYLPPDAIFATASVSSTPSNAPAGLVQAAVESEAPVASLSALSSRVKSGDTVSVRVTSGEDIVGAFLRASASSLTVTVGGQSRAIPANDVQQVVRRRGASRVRRGLLIGAPVGALLGLSGCTRVDTPSYQPGSGPPPSCGTTVLGGVAIGAGIGALIGSRVWRPTLVHSTPPGAPEAAGRAAVDTPTPVVAPTPVDVQAPVDSLGALSSRVKPFETIYVRRVSGEEIAGTFSRASEASLTMEVNGQTRDLPASDVQLVWRRGGNRMKQGMLFGFVAGAAVGLIAKTASDSAPSSEYSRGGMFALAGFGGGIVGLTYGAIIGAFVHERPLVYRAASPTVRVMPVLAPDRVGLMASVHF